jgi:hypothetical protein
MGRRDLPFFSRAAGLREACKHLLSEPGSPVKISCAATAIPNFASRAIGGLTNSLKKTSQYDYVWANSTVQWYQRYQPPVSSKQPYKMRGTGFYVVIPLCSFQKVSCIATYSLEQHPLVINLSFNKLEFTIVFSERSLYVYERS